MSRVLFFVIVLLILTALDFYVFQGYKLLTKKWASDYQSLLNIVYWVIPIGLFISLIILNLIGVNMHNSVLFRFVLATFIILYLIKLIWLFFIILDDIIRLARFFSVASDIPNEAMIEKINRSEFLITTGALASGALFGGMIYGVLRGAHNYQVNKRVLNLKNLPKAFEGLRIVQISDIHSGSFWNKPAVKKGVEMIVRQNADIIFFTGDLVNNKSEEFESFKEMFSSLTAPLGVYSVLGNHDYGDYVAWPDEKGLSKEENLQMLKKHQKDIGWNLLLNENHIIEKDGEQIAIIGVENWGAHSGFSKYGNLQKAHQGTEGVSTKLLLSHDPSHWKAEVLTQFKDIDAMFSGHTHGMQFGIDTKHYKWSPVKYRYPEWADLYQEGHQYLYVNRGFGYLGYPGRLGFNPEITVFELKSV